MPRLIQRKRTRGWRMPEGAVYVGRPTKWGNPFDVAKYGREKALEYYRAFLTGEYLPEIRGDYRKAEKMFYGKAPMALCVGELAVIWLRGKDLACWCVDWDGTGVPPGVCHAEILLQLANKEMPK